jgi:hypothetical protein
VFSVLRCSRMVRARSEGGNFIPLEAPCLHSLACEKMCWGFVMKKKSASKTVKLATLSYQDRSA